MTVRLAGYCGGERCASSGTPSPRRRRFHRKPAALSSATTSRPTSPVRAVLGRNTRSSGIPGSSSGSLLGAERDRQPAESSGTRAYQEQAMPSSYQRRRPPARLHRRTPTVSPLPIVALLGVALTWGVAFVVVKYAVAQIPPAVLVAWRFSLAAMVVLVFNPKCLARVGIRSLARSMVLGVVLGAGFLLQTWGSRRRRWWWPRSSPGRSCCWHRSSRGCGWVVGSAGRPDGRSHSRPWDWR